jgi:TPR repeat protein
MPNGNKENYMGMTEMRKYFSQTFVICILLLIGFSSAALADEVVANEIGEFALAEDSMNQQDLREAALHYRKAAEQNYLPAQTALGELMRVSQDYEEAFGWFLMSAYQGDAAGAYHLGQAYATGEGVEKNLGKAVYWIRTAAEKNNLTAAETLTAAYRTGDLGLTKDPDQVKKWESRLPGMRAAAQKEFKEKMAERRVALRELRRAAIKAAAAKKAAAKKAEDEAAAKKVDSADVATAKSAAENAKPAQTK